ANVVLTAFKPGAGHTTVLRIYEAAGQAVKAATIKLNARIGTAHEANLLEDAGHKMSVHANTLQFDLHPFEIKTVQLQLKPSK
ncbi:MAG: hypothetical protein DME25_13230, partial [Verrucomicrobia bacterium]